MKTKAKKFSHKLLALFMAIVMALTCFSGALSAFAANSDATSYNDEAIDYNSLGWAVLSDEQTATALLDYADEMLREYGPVIDNLLKGALPSSGMFYYKPSTRTLELNVASLIKNSVKIYTHSVNELLQTLESVQDLLDSRGSLVGTAGKLTLKSVHVGNNTKNAIMQRNNSTSCDIIRGVLGIFQTNFSNYNGDDPLGDILRGDFTLGTLGTFVKLDLYGMLGGLVGARSGFEKDLVYNLAQDLIFNNTKWYTQAQKDAFLANPSSWNYDNQLLSKLTTELLDKISVLVTYDQEFTLKNGEGTELVTEEKVQDTSATRYDKIKAYMDEHTVNYATAAAALGYDPNLVYTDEFKDKETGNYQNILLFAYGSPDENGLATAQTQMISLTNSDSLFEFGLQALTMAWKTVLKGTVKLLHVNYDVDRDHGSNFDNAFYYWMQKNGGWNKANPAANYSAANVEAWMADVASVYGASSMEEFKGWVRHNFEFTRTSTDEQTGKWSDIEETQLFNKVRYSPLADLYFNMQTGPINLYFMQLGSPNIDAFFDSLEANKAAYPSMVAGLNDALLAAVKDIFVQSDNVIGNLTGLISTKEAGYNLSTINDASIRTIVTTLTTNALNIITYTADAIDANILKQFRTNHPGQALTEGNLEEAMLPLLIACIGQINLGSGKLERLIHPEDWDACTDAEAVIYLCLREYLSYVLPQKNYDLPGVYTKNADGTVTINATLEGIILPMARDAVSYVMQGFVPLKGADGQPWDVYDRPVNDPTTIFDLLDSVLVYYGGEYVTRTDGNRSMAIGALLGLVDPSNGTSTIASDGTADSLWNNIKKLVDRLLPVVGVLQYGDTSKYGNCNPKDLIWNDIVRGCLDIDKTNLHSTGLGGVSNFLYRFLTIVSAEPIQSTPITITIYNFLADVINGLFGARYTAAGQTYTWIVPYCTSGTAINPTSRLGSGSTVSTSTPFDSFFHKASLFGSSNGQCGAAHKLVDNFVEFFGYGNSGVRTYPDSMMPAISFALKAVQSFIPEAIFNLGDHELRLASSEFVEPTKTGCASGTAYPSKVTLYNNCNGVNYAYIDGMDNNKVKPQSRYWLSITNVQIKGSNNGTCSVSNVPASTALIEPGKSAQFDTSVTYNSKESFKVTITYNLCEKNGTVIHSGLTSVCYKYVTDEKSWEEVVYPEDRDGWFPTDLENNAAGSTNTYQGYRTFTSDTFLNGNKGNVLYPEYFVMNSSELYKASNYQVRFRENENKDRGMDGIYCFDIKTVDNNILPGTTSVAVDQNNPIPLYDKETGDLLKMGRYDYSTDGGVHWSTNMVPMVTTDVTSSQFKLNYGFDEEYVANIAQNLSAADQKNFAVRTCHIFTLQDLINHDVLAAAYRNPKTGLIDHLYLKNNTSETHNVKENLQTKKGMTALGNKYEDFYMFRFDTLLGWLSMRGPVEGIYIAVNKITVPGNGSKYTPIFAYDNETAVPAGRYPVQVACYSSSKTGYIGEIKNAQGQNVANNNRPCTLFVVDTTSKDGVNNAYRELKRTLNEYEVTDFADYNPSTGKSAIYDEAENALVQSLAAESSVVTVANADNLSDKRELVPSTEWKTATYGDIAYVPFMDGDEADIPQQVLATAYLNDEDSFYYFDAAYTMPLQSTVPYTLEDVDNNGDGTYEGACGEILVLGDDGNLHYKNTPVYTTEWDTNTYSQPWQRPTTTPWTNDKNEPYYEQITFVYRDVNGQKVNSDDRDDNNELRWKVKFPATEWKIIPNSGEEGSVDNRGLYTQAVDLLSYTIERVDKSINKDVAMTLFTNITQERTGLNENNYEVVTLNKMKEAAQRAEKRFKVNVSYTDKKGKLCEYTFSPTDAAGHIAWAQGEGYAVTVSTETSLSAIQARELLRVYRFYRDKIIERGYMGAQLEKEIVCATGSSYDKMTATSLAEYDNKGKVTTPAVVTNSGNAATPDYGAWNAQGQLVNEGPVIYSEISWNNYVAALAEAVDLATRANSAQNIHKNADYYNAQDAEDDLYIAQNSKCYSADSALQRAEIALTPSAVASISATQVEGATLTVDGVACTTPMTYEIGETITVDLQLESGYQYDGYITINGDKHYTDLPCEIYVNESKNIVPAVSLAPVVSTGITVSGTVVIANTTTGGASIYGLGGIEVVAGDEVVAVTADDGTFTTDPFSEEITELTFQKNRAVVQRTVTISGSVEDVVVPIILGDYTGDAAIDSTDFTNFLSYYGTPTKYADYNGDTAVDTTDFTNFLKFYGTNYSNGANAYAPLGF